VYSLHVPRLPITTLRIDDRIATVQAFGSTTTIVLFHVPPLRMRIASVSRTVGP
jgi:hypothetical protein